MIRPVARKDLPGLLRLLRWMDQSPERGVLAPEARDLEGLAEELEDGLVLLKEDEVAGYVGLYSFWDGAALEGPLAYREEDLPPLLEAAEERAQGVERLYAFPREENRVLRRVLEEAGFGLLHVTYFFVKRPEGLDYPAPEGVRVEEGFPGAGVYRELYRESEESWALRLRWTDEELEEHFQDPAVHLLVAYLGERPVGLAEVELEGGEASVAYIGVVPEARGKGIGRTLLSEAARLAQRKGADLLRVRAHDHEKGALDLYRNLGFSLEEAVATYAKELKARR
ncbi:acetyltransferase, N-acetylglutamate synthase [Thermus thermophilus]|uniref:GNAT family N-acetyltransferase n=1 Tax=Thermus thermophilus TaxID=274 RepID=UPI00090CB460|nr:GNAT family N-acetyltransferase [Thermus thermophilus]BAW01532.1 acetyltransferase, N-acetylglutamate synthase [Thermus thermophilus]BDB12158.1 acetyltransferase [Thermus thermophilus]